MNTYKSNRFWWKPHKKWEGKQEYVWEILVSSPQPKTPHSMISPPGEEDGYDQQAARLDQILIIQAGLLLSSACFTQAHWCPNTQLWLVYCTIPRQGDRFNVQLALNHTSVHMNSGRSQFMAAVTTQRLYCTTVLVVEIDLLDGNASAFKLFFAGLMLLFVALRATADYSTGSTFT